MFLVGSIRGTVVRFREPTRGSPGNSFCGVCSGKRVGGSTEDCFREAHQKAHGADSVEDHVVGTSVVLSRGVLVLVHAAGY